MTELGKKAWGDKDVREKYLSEVPTGQFAEPDVSVKSRLSLVEDSSTRLF